ncbi:hypothetical protein EX30DRAFT_394057 [Ascodesmis nigricans]|uniref:Large ribosomal subunit protein mL49 n=1 Tax=Ascodesmis nigricans TaxID=341454 RepID=A0A4S2N174_9PEZI|nr:hypothetical protein EX30DRAFT_394057 [Ascodesmis nigricans]
MSTARTVANTLRSFAVARPITPRVESRFLSISSPRFNAEVSEAVRKPTTSGPLPYFIHRTNSKNLPVYQRKKTQGPKLETQIRKIEGDVGVLKDHLVEALQISKDDITVNRTTNQILIKGHCRQKVMDLLTALGF